MTNDTTQTRRIAVIAAGLSNPSSTRMLADRLSAATVKQLADRGIQLLMAAPHQCSKRSVFEGGSDLTAIHVDHVAPPLRLGHRPRLKQHAAEVAVEHHHVERLRRGRNGFEQALEFGHVGLGQWGNGGRSAGHRAIVLCSCAWTGCRTER